MSPEENNPMENMVREHLRTNHYPPLSPALTRPALEAISRAGSGDWESVIKLPNGLSLSVREIIESLDLGAFLGGGEGEPEEGE